MGSPARRSVRLKTNAAMELSFRPSIAAAICILAGTEFDHGRDPLPEMQEAHEGCYHKGRSN
jgi:hypothetical protein